MWSGTHIYIKEEHKKSYSKGKIKTKTFTFLFLIRLTYNIVQKNNGKNISIIKLTYTYICIYQLMDSYI